MGSARKLRLGAIALLVLAFFTGCHNKPAGLHAVSGKVTYRGAHVPGGLIVFTPDVHRGESGPIAFGRIRDDGSYTLYTGEAVGATAGWYRVSVASLSGGAPAVHSEPWPPAVSIVPDKYRDPELSHLGCEVRAEQGNQLDFNLD